MVVLSLFYPNQFSGHTPEDYDVNRHVPLVRERWAPMGLTDIRLLRGIGTPNGASAPYRVVALVTFDSAEALSQALGSHGDEIFASIRRYTDIEPVIQISEALA